MFVGHFAVGFAGKKFAPKQNAAVLMMAPLFLDIVFPVLILAGVEKAHVRPGITKVMPVSLDSMPWSHSLLMSIVWSVLYAGVVFGVTKDRRGAVVCALLVFSHWICDWVTHSPDMQLWPGNETRVGLGLWNSLWGTITVELVMLVIGGYLYLSSTKAKDRVGAIVPIVFMVFLTIVYLANVFGPPPPSVKIFSLGIVAGLLLIPLIIWYDRHRVPVGAVASSG
ncbi:MAG: metal-dependent hydrolase [Myxococcaceae bacterium]